jgi:hypothetical protein
MDTDKDTAAPAAVPPQSADEPQAPDTRARWRLETLVPTLAVVVVAVTAVITAVMVSRGPSPAASNGGAAACRNCGVVQMVVAVHEYGQPKPSSYQMHIRMDDGSTRTVEQRAALAAGSRVVIEGKSVRPLPAAQPGGR